MFEYIYSNYSPGILNSDVYLCRIFQQPTFTEFGSALVDLKFFNLAYICAGVLVGTSNLLIVS